MFKKIIVAGLLVSASAPSWAESGQSGPNQIWGNPTTSQAPSKPSNVGSFLTQGPGITISGTPKATIGITNSITAAGPMGSATQTIVLTFNAQGEITAATLATIAPPFSAVTGSLACSQEPAHTGDTTSPAGSCVNTTVKVNGVAFGTSPSTDTTPVITATNTATYTALPNCPAGTGFLNYVTSTHLFSCNAGGSGNVSTSGTPTAGQVAVFSSGAAIGGASQASLLTNASVQTTSKLPTGTASTTGVMMGLGLTGCTITPALTGRVEFVISGFVANSAAALSTSSLRFGTGTAPSNTGSPTGTQLGAVYGANSAVATAALPLTMIGISTGLTLGTPVWFDADVSVSSGTASLTVACTAHEF
jgi:hypothetical protein